MENAETHCREALKRLYPYIDGEIAGLECMEVERHLAECGDCLQHFGFERELKELIRRKCSGEAVPDGLADRMRARLRDLLA